MRAQVLVGILLGGLLLPLAPGAAGQGGDWPDEPLYEILDERGDVRANGFGLGASLPSSPTNAPNTATDPWDLRAFRILEDAPDRLTFEIVVHDMQTATADLQENGLAGFLAGPFFRIHFGVAGTDVMYQLVNWGTSYNNCSLESLYQCDLMLHARLCIYAPGSGCYPQPASARLDPENHRVVFHVPKLALLGQETMPGAVTRQTPESFPKHLAAGSMLDRWYVEYGNNAFYDRAPDIGTGDPYRLLTTTANTRIAVRLADPEAIAGPPQAPFGSPTAPTAPEIGITPGHPTVVPLRIVNDAGAKRLVNLSAEFLGEHAAQFTADLAPVLAIPHGEDRVVNLIVNASNRVEHRHGATLLVRADATGHPEELGLLRLDLMGSVPPSPDRPTLHFHATAGSTFFGGPSGYSAWLNTVEDDPRSEVGSEGFGANAFLIPGTANPWRAVFRMDTPLTHDLVFDTEEAITAKLRFTSQFAFDAETTLQLFAGGEFLGQAGRAARLTSQPSDLEFAIFLSPENQRVAASEGRISAIVTIRPASSLENGVLDTVRMHLRDSQIELPLVDDPEAVPPDIRLGPARLGLSYQQGSPPVEEFVNPNRTKLFPLVLVNEGVQADTARLNLTFEEDLGWTVEVAPALRFSLAPGESVTVAVFVRAPAEAGEGDQFRVRVEAVSGADNQTRAWMTLTAITTQGIDIPDERHLYTADEETLARALRDHEARAPGPGVLAFLLLALLAALAVPRRRMGPTR